MVNSYKPFGIVCASYGNDSLALLQYIIDSGWMVEREFVVIYNNTGWSSDYWPDRVKLLSYWAKMKGFHCFETKSIGMENLVKSRKGWPRQGMQFCTRELKIEPTLQWLNENDPDKTAWLFIGKRREESSNRSETPYSEMNTIYNRMVCHPLYIHTEQQRNALITKAGFAVLPHRSKECKVCINERRDGLVTVSEKEIAEIEKIENELGYTSLGKPRTMFRPYRHMNATGIREIIRWAQSDHGQFDPDDGGGYNNSACNSGMCE